MYIISVCTQQREALAPQGYSWSQQEYIGFKTSVLRINPS